MLSESTEATLPGDTPEARRFAAVAVGSWLVALAILPSGGLLWQLGAFTQLSEWLVGSVLAKLELTGFFF